MNMAETIKEITMQDEFFDTLTCQNELLAQIWTDKPNSFVLNSMARCDDIYKVLRLICIHCVVSNGLKPALLEAYKREIIRVLTPFLELLLIFETVD